LAHQLKLAPVRTMHHVSFEGPAQRAGSYLLRARFDGRTVRCIATRHVLVDCLGAAISTAGDDLVRAGQACRPTLEYAFRNRILAGDFERHGGATVVLTHDTFFHWANCFGPDPPDR
jgi:hypothetical protein